MSIPQSDWHEKLGQLIDLIGDDRFPDALLTTLATLVEFDDAVVLAYSEDHVPVILCDRLHQTDRDIFYKSYFSGVYLASPFYQAFQNKLVSGIYRLRALAPDRFYQSEYYRRYYQHIGARDLLSYLIHASSNWALLISIGRQNPSRVFSNADLAKLQTVEPVVKALGMRHWQNPWQASTDSQHLHQAFKLRFDAFGESVLTQRELDVVRLLLMGHSSKSVAEALTITHETVRVHRKNIYRKLQVGSQGELFSLFIAQLTSD